jgi:tellurite resistance protein TerB
MGLFDGFKKLIGGVDRQINPKYSENKDFLEACCAAAASVAMADGSIDDSERDTVIDILSNHAVLGKVYSSTEIKTTADTMFRRAGTNSGKLSLAREVEDVKGKGAAMAQDVYMVALDVAMADGDLAPEEEKVLERLATRLGVDIKTLM